MKPILVALLLGLLFLFSGCIQPKEAPVVAEKMVTEEWKPDGVIGRDEYSRSMVLQGPARQGYTGGEMEISWKNDREYLYMALNSSANGWLSLGFEPLEWMKNADIVLASIQDKAIVLDEYCTGNYGPHIEDTLLGGTNDITEYAGRRDLGHTVIEFKRKLNTGDRFDKAFVPGQAISIIWALSQNPEISQKHNTAYGEGILTLTAEPTMSSAARVLSEREKEGLSFIWEEEKLARDIYMAFYDKNNLNIFKNLMESEKNHMDQAKGMIDKYGLQLPEKDEVGVFENKTLEDIYSQLLADGQKSDIEALKAAATYEEISIRDLEKEISASKMEDIRIVYQGLLAGSRKHLRSYVSNLQDLGIKYTPQILSKDEYNEILLA